jgi:hypothetical protein
VNPETIKIIGKNLGRKRCGEGFNFGVRDLKQTLKGSMEMETGFI